MGEWCTVTLSEYDDDGILRVQVDAHGTTPTGRDTEAHHAYGFMGRPRDPDEDGTGCVAHKSQFGSDSLSWAADDPRVTPNLPELDKGGSVMYGGNPTLSWVLVEEDGSLQVYVPYSPNVAGVPQKCFTLRFDTSTEAITLQHSQGQTICMTKEKEIVLAIDDSTHLTLSAGKIVLQAEQVIAQGTMLVGNPLTAVALNQFSSSSRLLVSPA
jgi:hypothetical protein